VGAASFIAAARAASRFERRRVRFRMTKRP
jgi:hypothetical protein